MKRLLIGALVGGIILFIWQFISWAAINFHRDMQKHTPNQDKILEFLNENLEEGYYFLPMAAPGEDEQKVMQNAMGKPWAQVYFHKEMTNNMAASMSRGIVIDFLTVLLVCWILIKLNLPDFKDIFLSCIAIGLIGYFSIPYLNSIWFETPTIPYLIDATAGWGLVGLWLGWWLRK